MSLVTGAVGTGVPVIAAERNAPSRFDYMSNKRAKTIAYNSFRMASRITVQCPSYVNQYPEYIRKKIVVIPNSVDAARAKADAAGVYNSMKEILFVGRLDYQKNPATLLSAFAKIHECYPDWVLRFVGGGPYEEKLLEQAEKLGIASKVFFEGMQKDVEKYYAAAQIFCLPSLWEGFPNALGEAMAHGLPSVGFQSCSGVCDLIENGVTGFLAEGKTDDAESLSQNLAKLMESDDVRKAMGAASYEAMNAYEPKQIYDRWEELFLSVSRH
ncbi:MAG: glycosyltransferase family 4 protein [Micavibrio aeruginosavorus]|uniref:Glycosyltransferase family 4 protein n=1 Tax=Micavibrio aeruginosavorus TaxID=349221 RepID=A0A2W4ZXS2_9BACT|nr:MAG: glycosyltransferase family 4 protein [Micavibrio aeruginosavorus]